MPNAFKVELRAQQEWSWLLAIWLFLGGVGGGLFLCYLAFALAPVYGALSLALIMAGGGVLLLELGNPLRAWRTIFHAGASWLSRGALFVVVFVVSTFLSVGQRFEILSWLTPLANSLTSEGFDWIAGLSAVMIILYPAFFFRSTSRAIPFWNTPLLPLLFAGYALMGGAGVVLLLTPYLSAPPHVELLSVALIVINAAMLAIYLAAMERAGGSARESVRLLNRAPLNLIFWIGVVLIGIIVPLAGILFVQSALAIAGGFLLVGGFLFRYCVLKAGVYIPPAVVPAWVDLSKLNRTSAEFEREYARMGSQRTSRAG